MRHAEFAHIWRSHDAISVCRKSRPLYFVCAGETHTYFDRNIEEHHFAVMLLLYATVCFVLFGPAAGVVRKEVCFGRHFSLPSEYTAPVFHGKVYFTPSGEVSRKLLIDNGKLQVEDPRIHVGIGSVTFTDLKESDDGIISVSYDGLRRHDVIRLIITDCSEFISHTYGDKLNLDVPRDAEFLEFSPGSDGGEQVLWNRTNPQTNRGSRGKLRRNVWEITRVTQSDNGFYNFRRKDNFLTRRIHLRVEADHRYDSRSVGEQIFIENPPYDGPWSVTFASGIDPDEEILLIEAGRLVKESYYSPNPFSRRIRVVHGGIMIDPVEDTDGGIFRFKDPQDNVALISHLGITPVLAPGTSVYVGVSVGVIIGTIVCCCCVRKCCCKKSSSKRDVSAPELPVYDHSQDQNQPAVPSYSAAPASHYSPLPRNPPVSKKPATYSPGLVQQPVNVHVNPPQPEAAAPGGQGAAPAFSLNSDYLSSDAEPKFELKGLNNPSAYPLSSDSTFCDVYTSDKLNFLGGAQ